MIYGRQFNILLKVINNNFDDRIEFYNFVNNILKYVIMMKIKMKLHILKIMKKNHN